MPTLRFTVDAALLRELGERLVGRAYIALAELVKNSYDADATKVVIKLDPKKDRIEVSDNGHGMGLEEFKDFWMRIGSIHKQRQRVSRNLHRPMTGSKGVGRLAVQYLADSLELFTVSENDLNSELQASVRWEEATKARELTEATVEYNVRGSNKQFEKGTRIVLIGLKQRWTKDDVEGLAKEIWWLQPPFRGPSMVRADSKNAFEIEFISEEEYERAFNWQMKVVLDKWYARLVGESLDGNVHLVLEYAGKEPIVRNYIIEGCKLRKANFEIRIYHWKYRQPHGIKVGEARDYFNRFGGVHVYDGGFHLPYYGDPKNDWLRVEIDHSHRLTLSQLLPPELHIPQGLQFLPTLSRIFGVVNLNTSEEDDLKISITRDRLRETAAFDDLSRIIRWALDYYAYEEKVKSLAEKETAIVKPKYQKIEAVLAEYKPKIPENVYEKLEKDMQETTNAIETEAEKTAEQVELMGPLATAGISSLAYQHETKKQFLAVENILEQIGEIARTVEDAKLRDALMKLKEDLSTWVERARATNALFAYYADATNLKTKKRFLAKKVIGEIKEQVEVLARGIPIDITGLDDNLLLPKASLIEWSAIFQNVFINAFNALVDSEKKLVYVNSKVEDGVCEILVQDTGCGVNLKEAETLFEPFVRRIEISSERQALGYGGMGLGLTIVRMVANSIGCTVSFVEPEKGFNTAFSLRWREIE